jgi:hypothetical protein
MHPEEELHQLLALASGLTPFRATHGQPYISLPLGDGGHEVCPIASTLFQDWLLCGFDQSEGRPPRPYSLRQALRTLEARATQGPKLAIHHRIAAQGNPLHPEAIYIHLADRKGQSIEITPTGIQVVTDNTIAFADHFHTAPLREPASTAAPLESLQALLNLASPADTRVVINWLLAAHQPAGPYPILVLEGQPGSGKSRAARRLRQLVDPSTTPLFAIPSSDRALHALAQENWLLAFDHVGPLRRSASDTLCRLSTGIATFVRTSGPNCRSYPLEIARPILITTAGGWKPAPDLERRIVTAHLAAAPSSQSPDSDAFDEQRPHLQRALYEDLQTRLLKPKRRTAPPLSNAISRLGLQPVASAVATLVILITALFDHLLVAAPQYTEPPSLHSSFSNNHYFLDGQYCIFIPMGKLVILALFGSTATSLHAQVGASLSGTVLDATGAPLPEARITVKNAETGALRQVPSDDAGRYSAPSLPVGRYEILAEKAGFKSELRTGITLVVGQAVLIDLTLQVGELKETMTVTESAPTVNLSTEETSGVVNERQVKELPLNGRSYDELITLNPGIVNYTIERSGGVGVSNSAVGNMFAVSGRRPQESIFLLNGIEYTSASEINLTPGGASGQLLGVDAVREFNVVTDTYGAQYGKRPGAQVSVVTASGTNQLHGSVYEFLRNSDFDARNFFDQGGVPQFQRNQFGAAVGGPIKKDKTFIFGNYEGFHQHLGLSDVTLVPDNNARQGYVPGATGKLVNVGLGPGVAQLLTLWPVQNGPEIGGGIGEAFSHPLQTIREDFGTTRIDHIFSPRDTLSGIYTVDDSADHTPTVNPLSYVVESLREQVASLEETHVFSPSVLNVARIGFSRASYFFTGGTTVNLPGWVSGTPIGTVVIGSTASNAATQISSAGTNAGDNITAARNLFTEEDRVSIAHGRHQIEAGVWLQRIQANDNFAQAQFGQASFGSLTTLLQGTVGTFTAVPSPTPMGWRSLEGAFFVQDTIKLRPNLELRLGFRDEFTNGWNEATGRASNYLFDANGVIETNPRIGNSVFTQDNAKFLPAPRVGLAWDPFGHQKTVIRAGFGIYYSLLDDLSFRLDQTAPFNTTLSLKNVPISTVQLVPGAPLPAGSKISPAGDQPNMQTGTVESYSFKVEQQLAANTSLSVGYAGSHGYHEILSVDANEPVATVCPASPCPAGLASGTLYYPTGAPLANPNLANTTSWFSEGISSYNALQLDVKQRFGQSLQIRGVYTFSKSLDDGATLNSSVASNAPGFVMIPAYPKVDWGPSTFDVRHLAAINASWELPVGHGRQFLNNITGWRNALIGGWTMSGIATLQSGFPFTAQLGYNPSNNGDTRNPVRPSVNPAFSGPVILGGPNEYFNPNAFTTPVPGTYGNVGRDTLIGPGLAQLDISFLKNTALSERTRLQFRAELFNILNHTNFGTPNPVIFGSSSSAPLPTAGVITGTSTTSRQIQFGLKLLW